MRKELVDSLIGKLKMTNRSIDDIKFVLSKDEAILEKLALVDKGLFNVVTNIILMYKNDCDIVAASDLLTSAREEVLAYLIKVLTNADLVDNDIVIAAAKIINAAKEEYNAYYACKLLTDRNAIKIGIALEGAEIISQAKIVVFVYKFLLNNYTFSLDEKLLIARNIANLDSIDMKTVMLLGGQCVNREEYFSGLNEEIGAYGQDASGKKMAKTLSGKDKYI